MVFVNHRRSGIQIRQVADNRFGITLFSLTPGLLARAAAKNLRFGQ
jgi:hypothetical protein